MLLICSLLVDNDLNKDRAIMIKSDRPFIGGDYSRHYNRSNLPKSFQPAGGRQFDGRG
jgi:hypothetical protein